MELAAVGNMEYATVVVVVVDEEKERQAKFCMVQRNDKNGMNGLRCTLCEPAMGHVVVVVVVGKRTVRMLSSKL
jgi:hypothetical protein